MLPRRCELAKAMIRDGRMPTPEEAARQLRERLDRDRLGEPWEPLQDTSEPIAVAHDNETS